MEKKVKKLTLHRETVKSLRDEALKTAAGADTFTRICTGCCTLSNPCSTCCP